VYARGAIKQTIFRDDADRLLYLRLLEQTCRRAEWLCLSYCLMGTHMHLLIETPRPNLGWGMQRLHGMFGRAFNMRHGQCGHAFEARYNAKLVTTDAQIWMTVAYIARNPVEAGLCSSPEAWPWSSHAAIASGKHPSWLRVRRLLDYFKSMGGDPLTRYLELVAASSERHLNAA
jgi:putative transposase